MAEYILKKGEILNLYHCMCEKTYSKNTSFNYTKSYNKNKLYEIAKPLAETQHVIQSIISKYNDECHEIIKKYAKRDKDGNPQIKQKTTTAIFYDISEENLILSEKECEVLKDKYKNEFDEYEKSIKEFEEILQQEEKVQIMLFKRKDLPQEIEEHIMDTIFNYIDNN